MGLTGGKNIFPVVSLGVPHYIIIREAIMINNKALSENEIKMLSFFTDKIEWQRDDIIYQINHAEIRTECSPYFYIIKFVYEESSNLLSLNYKYDLRIQIIHGDTAPTVMILFIKEGRVQEFEVYNADSSNIVFERLYEGYIIKEF
jgi:hypothetical protein